MVGLALIQIGAIEVPATLDEKGKAYFNERRANMLSSLNRGGIHPTFGTENELFEWVGVNFPQNNRREQISEEATKKRKEAEAAKAAAEEAFTNATKASTGEAFESFIAEHGEVNGRLRKSAEAQIKRLNTPPPTPKTTKAPTVAVKPQVVAAKPKATALPEKKPAVFVKKPATAKGEPVAA